MFLYHSSFDMSLLHYGIKVPIEDNKFLSFKNYINKELPHLLKTSKPTIQITDEILELAHNKDFIKLIRNNPREVAVMAYELIDSEGNYNRYDPTEQCKGFEELIQTGLSQVAGTIEMSLHALEHNFAYLLAGGHHHAMTFGARGFCMINDIIIAARYIQKQLGCKTIWIIDTDAHKGDGTAEIAKDDPTLCTLSIHMADGWPLDEGAVDAPWFIPSDLDIPIKQKDQRHYVDQLRAGLFEFDTKFPKPDLAIVVQGSDPYEKDSLESASLLKLTKNEMLQRDLFVYNFLKEREIPQAYVMSGGYGPYAHEPYIHFIDAIKNDL